MIREPNGTTDMFTQNKQSRRLSPSRGLGRKINEQDRSSIESEDKSRCSDQYYGVFFIIATVEIAQMEMLIAKYTPLCGSGALGLRK